MGRPQVGTATLLIWAILAGAALLPASPAVGQPIGPRTYRPPTAGAVLDPFRPPPEPWLPGNRGIEYATEPGSSLVAIGPGVVVFAGSVAGRLVVSIDHPDGLRSALTGVAAVEVDVGQVVMGGERVARAGAGIHLGVRRNDTYLDPASLWGHDATGGRAVLVPEQQAAPEDRRFPATTGSSPDASVGAARARIAAIWGW